MVDQSLSRRTLLRGFAVVAGASTLAMLAACSSVQAPAPTAAAPAAAATAAAPAAPTIAPATGATTPAAATAPKTKGMTTVGVRLGWLGNGEFAVLYVGLAKGFYAAEGIDLAIHDGGPGKKPVIFVAAGKDDMFGVTAGASDIFQARAASSPIDVVAVGTLLQVHPYAWIRIAKMGTPDPTPKDLIGKKLGIQPNDDYFVTALAKKNNIDPKSITLVTSGATPEQLLLGKIDFYAGWVTNQAYDVAAELKKQGKTDETWQGLLYNKWGQASYADTLFCTGDSLKKRADLVRGFLTATAKGMEFLYNNPKESIPMIRKYTTLDSVDKLTWRLQQQNPLMVSADTKENGVLWMNADVWKKDIAFFYDYKQLSSKPPVEQVMTNAYLPGTPKL